jgi:hypothetical protein
MQPSMKVASLEARVRTEKRGHPSLVMRVGMI